MQIDTSAAPKYVDFVISVGCSVGDLLYGIVPSTSKPISLKDAVEAEIFLSSSLEFLGISASLIPVPVLDPISFQPTRTPGKLFLEKEDIDDIVDWAVELRGADLVIGEWDGSHDQLTDRFVVVSKNGRIRGLIFPGFKDWVRTK